MHVYIKTYFVHIKNDIYIYICISLGKLKLSIHVRVCMYVCSKDVRMEIDRVLNEICTQLGMLRCKIYVVVFLGEPNT